MSVDMLLKVAIGIVGTCFVAVVVMDRIGRRPRIRWLQRERMAVPVTLLAMIPMAVMMIASATPQLNWSSTMRLGVMLWFLIAWLIFAVAFVPLDEPNRTINGQ